MKRVLAVLLVFAMVAPAFAVEDGEVVYSGGTATTLKEGAIGKLDTTSQSALTFESGASKLRIPYERIQSYEYSRQLARHYGALLTIAIVMFKYRQRRHFVRITYLDDTSTAQVAVFEVPKTMPRTLMAVLQTRAPQGCKPNSFGYDASLGMCPAHPKTAGK